MNQYRDFKLAEPLDFRMTRSSPCSYLPGQTERRLVADITRHRHLHDNLARAGFRRVENWVYRPICGACNACRPIRIASGNGAQGGFKPSRGQRRIMRRNADLTRRVLPNAPHGEHYEIFRRYITARHGTGQMADMDDMHYADMIAVSPIDTVLVEYRDADGAVVAVMLCDMQADGLSAVYSFYDPADDIASRSLGTFMVCDLAAVAHEMKLPHVYLGYYIAGSAKMNYKARFHSAEILEGGEWIPLAEASQNCN